MEIWKEIENTGHRYSASNKGRVKNNLTEKILKPSPYENGYLAVSLTLNGKTKKYRIHRLVGKCFVPNPNGYNEINHIDENKTNNSAENLEWCTHRQNINHGSKVKRTTEKISKPCQQSAADGQIVETYPSMNEAARRTGFSSSNISKACRFGKQYNGFFWSFI